MTVKCMYYSKQYGQKPDKEETKKIQKLLNPTTIDIGNLAQGLSNGATFKPALLNGTKSIDWVSQQLFALDFDHGTTIQRELKRCKELNILPCFGYTSFSHSKQEHHFRLIFCTDKNITDRNIRNKLQDTLIAIFNSDKVTYDCTRMFYGGESLICDTYNNRINAEQVINQHWKPKISNMINSNTKTVPTCKKKLKIYSNTELNEHVDAIKRLDVAKMRKLLEGTPSKSMYSLLGATFSREMKKGTPSTSMYSLLGVPFSKNQTSIELHSQDELFKFINAIDLAEYLGIEYGEKFNCILPEHEDNSPSACIWTTTDGTQIYKCFGCGHAFTIISLTEKLAQCSRSKAIEFIKSVYGIVLFESDWTKQWKQKLINYASYLDSKELEITFPKLASLIRTRKTHMKSILLYFSTLVNEDMQINGNPFFFASYKKLMQVCGIKSTSHRILSESLVLFSLLNMINKMQVKTIPEKEYYKAKQIANSHGFKKLTGFYSFNEYGVMSFENSEEIAKILKDNHMTLKGLSREYVLRTFGTKIADKVYPQFKSENKLGTLKKSDYATNRLMNKLCNIINKQGYCLESDIKGKGQTEIQWKRSIQQILNVGNFKRVKASKANKLKYHIPGSVSYQSYVIVNK